MASQATLCEPHSRCASADRFVSRKQEDRHSAIRGSNNRQRPLGSCKCSAHCAVGHWRLTRVATA
ncbi:unnamed protein product, partial [Mycena citricolor]